MAALFCRVPTLLAAESFPIIGLLLKRNKTIETAPLPSKLGPTLKIGVEITLLPLLRVLRGSKCPRWNHVITPKKKTRNPDRWNVRGIAIGDRCLDGTSPNDRSGFKGRHSVLFAPEFR